MTPAELPREQSDKLREKQLKVLDAAWRVFLKYGYKRVTMADLADAAEISRPALYLVFSKKEDVFRAVVRHNGKERLAKVLQGLPTQKSPKDKLEYAFEHWSVQPFDAVLGSEEVQELIDCGFDFARADMEASYSEFEAVIASILQPVLKAAGTKNPSAKHVAHILVSSSRGFKLVAKSSSEYRDMIGSLLNITLAGLER